ncbi:proteasome subunit alpha type-6-like isoform X2 [Phragmites australis]|uniref:proteasome subunit alpha type-6-like isoform X2 n=1 Tax=Phragmites australis TaxID=29695 RepID=UPI002D772047|nr:proteasome subunit alpha type-6-like isoform X2 [Phragmites australis]
MPVAESSSGSSRRGRGTDAPPYDRLVTVFSSEGRLYQVDYAWNAVRLAGVTSVGVRGADSVCVVGQRKAPKAKDKLLDAASVSRLFPITERMGLLTAGIAGDGRSLAHEARNQSAEFRFTWGYEMPPDVLAQWIADRAQICTQHVSKRPSGVVAMILGIDEEKETPQLFTCDPAGYFLGHKMAISALRHALQGDLKATEIEVGVVRNDDPIFRLLTEAEIEEHLKAITTLKQS